MPSFLARNKYSGTLIMPLNIRNCNMRILTSGKKRRKGMQFITYTHAHIYINICRGVQHFNCLDCLDGKKQYNFQEKIGGWNFLFGGRWGEGNSYRPPCGLLRWNILGTFPLVWPTLIGLLVVMYYGVSTVSFMNILSFFSSNFYFCYEKLFLWKVIFLN